MIVAAIALFATLAQQTPGEAFIARGQTSIARGDFAAAAQAADAAGAANERAAAEEIRGAIAEERDSMSAAAGHYEEALRLAERDRNSTLMADAEEMLSRVYGQQGRIDLTLDLANRMLERDPSNRAQYLFERGIAYSTLNDPEAAIAALDEALALANRMGNLKLIAQIHRQRGLWTWRYKRDLAQTLHEYDEALDYAQRAQAWRVTVLTLINYGNPLRNSSVGRSSEALQRYVQALVIARREHLSHEIAYLLKNMGDVYRQQGDFARAEPMLDEAVQMADKANVEEVRWMARDELGMLLRNRDPARAERNLRDALDIIENYQSDVLLEDFRPGVLATEMLFANPYEDLIDLLITEHRDDDAFSIAERQRARAFLETLSASRTTLATAVTPRFRDAEREVLDRIKSAQARLRGDDLTDAARAALVMAVQRDETQLTHLRLRLAVESPSLAHARFPRTSTIHDAQSGLLHSDETLLSIYLGSKRSVAWVVTPGTAHTVTLPASSEIENRVRAALEELRNPLARDRSALAAASRALSIDTIVRLARGTRLIVVPSGILYDVPFEALLDGSGHPLLERFAVSYVPSASSLAFLRSTSPRPQTAQTFVGVANPVVRGATPAASRQFDLAHMNLLAPVPNTATEVRSIASLFENSSTVFEGAKATRSNVRGGIGQARILHFATHGLIDDVHPERSGLLLTADPPRDDGLLLARDVYGLRLSADLVTLSACETALGKNVTGEGMIGLTRAFFFAGARSVVASLWDVDDAATSRLMQHFYANIRRGEAIDIALQRAKLDLLHDPRTKAPFYWASFIANGQARSSIRVPPSTQPIPFAIILGGVLVAAIWYYRRIVNVRRSDVTTARP